MMQHFSFTSVALASSMLLFPVSAHAQECESDAECEEGYSCEVTAVSDQACSPDVPCEPVETVHRTCEPTPFTCNTDAECPTPARCNDRGECVYQFEVCELDSECGAGYVCTPIDSGSCSVDPSSNDAPPRATDLPGSGSSGSGSGSSGSAGEADPLPARDLPLLPEDAGGEPQDKPPEGDAPKESLPLGPDTPSSDDPRTDPSKPPPDVPAQGVGSDVPLQCEPRDVRVCLPAPVSCTSDADCLPEWQCVEVPPGGPESWDGVERACFPPGLIAAIDGRVKTEGGGAAQDNSSGEGPIRGEDRDLSDGDDGVGGGSIEPPTAELGTQGGSEGSSGCHVTSPSNARSSGLWLGIGLSLLLGMRRRR